MTLHQLAQRRCFAGDPSLLLLLLFIFRLLSSIFILWTPFCVKHRFFSTAALSAKRVGTRKEEEVMGVCASRPKANEDLAAKKKNHRRRRRRILRRRVSSRKIEANNVAHSNSALQASNRASGASASVDSFFLLLKIWIYCFTLYESKIGHQSLMNAAGF